MEYKIYVKKLKDEDRRDFEAYQGISNANFLTANLENNPRKDLSALLHQNDLKGFDRSNSFHRSNSSKRFYLVPADSSRKLESQLDAQAKGLQQSHSKAYWRAADSFFSSKRKLILHERRKSIEIFFVQNKTSEFSADMKIGDNDESGAGEYFEKKDIHNLHKFGDSEISFPSNPPQDRENFGSGIVAQVERKKENDGDLSCQDNPLDCLDRLPLLRPQLPIIKCSDSSSKNHKSLVGNTSDIVNLPSLRGRSAECCGNGAIKPGHHHHPHSDGMLAEGVGCWVQFDFAFQAFVGTTDGVRDLQARTPL
jgi:hypothetical protein